MNIWLLIIIGFSLSMDTFSLALCLGTFNVNIKKGLFFSFIVGLFHFILPIIGNLLGNSLKAVISINPNKLLFIIFTFLAIEMLVDLLSKEDKTYNFSILNIFICAFSVSIDSLTVGLGLSDFTSVPIIGSVIFSIISFLFTYLGLITGKYSYKTLGKISKVIGLVIIIILATIHLIK